MKNFFCGKFNFRTTDLGEYVNSPPSIIIDSPQQIEETEYADPYTTSIDPYCAPNDDVYQGVYYKENDEDPYTEPTNSNHDS